LGSGPHTPTQLFWEYPPFQADASPLKADFARAIQKRSTTEYDLARQNLNKVAICQKWIYDKQLGGDGS